MLTILLCLLLVIIICWHFCWPLFVTICFHLFLLCDFVILLAKLGFHRWQPQKVAMAAKSSSIGFKAIHMPHRLGCELGCRWPVRNSLSSMQHSRRCATRRSVITCRAWCQTCCMVGLAPIGHRPWLAQGGALAREAMSTLTHLGSLCCPVSACCYSFLFVNTLWHL